MPAPKASLELSESIHQNDPFHGVTWYDAKDFGIRGLAWPQQERERAFDRLPTALLKQCDEKMYPLSTYSTGLHIDFEGAAQELFVRWTMYPEYRRNQKMSELANSGLDAYGRDDDGNWRWVGAKAPWQYPTSEGCIHREQLDGKQRQYRIYLPLLQRIEAVEIGCRQPLSAISNNSTQPIVYYGSSIVQGNGASRAGMCHAAQLGRLLDHEIYNFGFCGRAHCHPFIAEALSQLTTPLFIIDPLPNNSAEQLYQRLPAFLHTLRSAQADTPILLVEDRLFGGACFNPYRKQEQQARNEAVHKIIATCQRDGMNNLHLATHPSWFGEDGEGSDDGGHPNTLGAWRIAQELLPFVSKILS